MHGMFKGLYSIAPLEDSFEVRMSSRLTTTKQCQYHFSINHFRIHSGEKPYKCNRVDHECSKAFSTPHSLKSHLKTHEKKAQDRSKSSSPDDNKMMKKEFNFTASADIYPSGGSSSSDTDSMLFDNNMNMLQFHIVDGNGNNVKYSAPVINYVPVTRPNEAVQLSIANEVEMESPLDSQWVDFSVLANKSIIPSTPVKSSCVALSTMTPSYVNLPSYQGQINTIESYFNNESTEGEDQTLKELNDLLLSNEFDGEGKTLKSITADAGICQCTNCKCDPLQENGCVGGCGPAKPCLGSGPAKAEQVDKVGQMEIDTNKLIEEIDSLNVDTTATQPTASSCDCKNTKDAVDKGCCVVICLKTLSTLETIGKKHSCGNKISGVSKADIRTN